MKVKVVLSIVFVLLVVGGLAGVKALQIQKLIAQGKDFVPPPETVSSVMAQEEQWPDTLTSIGTVTAVQGVTITPELAGTVQEIAFQPGAVVAKGDLLVRLDTSTEEAQLRAIEAQADLARINLERMLSLRQDNTVSPSELDAAEAALKQHRASADAIRATIAKKTLRAPFAGRLGIRQIHLGEYLDTGKPIVSLQSLDPVHVDFSLPQQDLPQLETGLRVRLTTDACPGRIFEGTLTTINPDLDPNTRSVGLQATFDNPDARLRPGMFARVEVRLPGEQSVLVIPATSVLSAPYGDSVYVIAEQPGENGEAPSLSVRQQFIRTGRARGDFVSVVSGLKAGERIVSAGLFKLRNGMHVVVNNDLVPKTSETPRPEEG